MAKVRMVSTHALSSACLISVAGAFVPSWVKGRP
jgi:hypothetical protein